jgi:hypothetical protein
MRHPRKAHGKQQKVSVEDANSPDGSKLRKLEPLRSSSCASLPCLAILLLLILPFSFVGLSASSRGVPPEFDEIPSERASASSPMQHLTDRQLRQFIAQGFVVLGPRELKLQPSVHIELHRKAKSVDAETGTAGIGNNVLPGFPELQEIFAAPSVTGALTSLLGRNYKMHAHRHLHASSPYDQVTP